MRFLLLLSIVVSLVDVSAHAEATLPKPVVEKLDNGLTLVWFEDKRLPLVDMAMLIESGYRNDPQGKSGTASLLSSVLDRGAGNLSAEEFAKSVEKLGAQRYASADEDTFTIGMHGLAEDTSALMDLLAKQILQPTLPEEEVAREHARMLDRWRHIGDRGATLADLAYYRLITSGSPYGRGGFFSAEEFKKVTRKDLLDFHRLHFTPKNAVLMIVGKVNREELRKQIAEKFGKWTGEAPPPAKETYRDTRLQSGAHSGILVVNRKGLTQAQVRIGFRAPLISHEDHFKLVVANALLGEHFNSRLNSVIRDKLGLTYSIGSAFSYSRELAWFTIASATRNETVGELIQQVKKILGSMVKGTEGQVSEAEVKTAKQYLSGSFPLSVSTVSAVAARWLGTYIFDLGPEYLSQFVPRIRQVQLSDVRAAVKAHFKLDDLIIVISGDGDAISKSLKKSGLNFRQVTVKALQ